MCSQQSEYLTMLIILLLRIVKPANCIIKRVYKNHLKMVKGCRIDTGSCKKPSSKKDSPKTLGTRVSCKTGRGLGEPGKTGIGLEEHRAR